MKEILFAQSTPNGTIKGVLRIVHTKIFFKYNDSQMARNVIEEYRKKGVKVTFSSKNDWIMVEPFEGFELIKLRDKELDIKESTVEETEQFLIDFYESEYKRLGYHTELI